MKDLQNMIQQQIRMESLSEYRPDEMNDKSFRDYSEQCEFFERVKKTYYQMHTHQTVEFVRNKTEFWCQFNHAEMTIIEALHKINELIDESDPDVNIPNIYHAFQTAEQIREYYPDNDWLVLTGLIHDLGKVMALYNEEQWSVVGDTFPVGCAHSDEIVFGRASFECNPDFIDSRYNSQYGIYQPNCGLDNLTMSWGHDEYLYQVLKNHPTCTLTDTALKIIRYHSFYPWHKNDAYSYLCNEVDQEVKRFVKVFNSFDLYTKSTELPDIDNLIPYYQGLIDKYIPGNLRW